MAERVKASFLRRPWSNDLGSTRTLVTLFRPWIRRFTMIISAWWLRTSSKFSGQEFAEIYRNIGSSETTKQVWIFPITKYSLQWKVCGSSNNLASGAVRWRRINIRVFGFFTFCLNLFLYTILRVQIGMKKNRDCFFWKIFLSSYPGGARKVFGGRVWLISHNSKTTAPRKTIFTSIDSETQVSYLCSIHNMALTALFFELFSKNCFYPFLRAISL